MTTVVLNVKIDGELKEKLRQYAEENNENLGTATEEEASPLTPKEIKALRKILKKKK